MDPDIEWRVGEDDEQETIARTSGTRRSPRRLWAVLVALGLGAGLGLLYRSIPEPPPRPIGPTPAPAVIQSPLSPLPTLESLDAAIERDALRLASSAGEANHLVAFAAAGDKYTNWYAALQNAYGRWGTPLNQAMYTVFASGTLPSGVAWASLGQFRHGAVYRQTRFYRLENNRWLWTLPDRSFWSGVTSVITTSNTNPIGPIIFQSPIEDAPLSGPVVDRFSRVYRNLCESLNCPPPDQSRLWTREPIMSLTIKPSLIQPVVQERRETLLIDLPSPNVVGVYDEANGLGDPYTAMAYATLIQPIVRLASGDDARWDTDSGGSLFLHAIATWKRARLPSDLYLLDMFFQSALLPPSVDISPAGWLVSRRDYYVDQLRGESLVPPVSVWDWPTDGQSFGLLEHVAVAEAEAMVIYLEERYGPKGVVQFLNSLGKAHSLEEALETALPVSFAEFNRQWRQWIAGE